MSMGELQLSYYYQHQYIEDSPPQHCRNALPLFLEHKLECPSTFGTQTRNVLRQLSYLYSCLMVNVQTAPAGQQCASLD